MVDIVNNLCVVNDNSSPWKEHVTIVQIIKLVTQSNYIKNAFTQQLANKTSTLPKMLYVQVVQNFNSKIQMTQENVSNKQVV